MGWFREVILRERRIRALQEALDGVTRRHEEIERQIKHLDRDQDDLETYVKKVMGRVSGGDRKASKDAPEDINQQIRDGSYGPVRIR